MCRGKRATLKRRGVRRIEPAIPPSLPPIDGGGKRNSSVHEEETLYRRWLPPKTRARAIPIRRPPPPPPPLRARGCEFNKLRQDARQCTITVSLFINLCAIRYSSLGENVKVFADLGDRIGFPEKPEGRGREKYMLKLLETYMHPVKVVINRAKSV